MNDFYIKMDCEQQQQLYVTLAIILTVLLIASELLAWSNCTANGISQILLKCHTPAGDYQVEADRNRASVITPVVISPVAPIAPI